MSSERAISVILAVYNGERFVAEAIDSILKQTLAPHEIVVVNDGSTDATADIVRSYPKVRYLEANANAGQAAALNWGVRCATGDYLAFLDADDVWMVDKLERQSRAFDAQPDLDLVYGWARERVQGLPGALVRRDGAARPAYLPSAMLIRRSAFERVGGFDTRWRLGSVVDWYARACEAQLRQHVVPHVVYERRIHGANVGLVRARDRSDYLHVVKAALDRRRRQS